MKKIVINISDVTYQKLQYESIRDKKSINEIISERIFFKPFSEEIQKALDEFISAEINKL